MLYRSRLDCLRRLLDNCFLITFIMISACSTQAIPNNQLGYTMNPLLFDIPMPITTQRLLLRPPQAGDGAVVNEAILESFETLTQWMPWADHRPSVKETEANMRTFQAKWILRESLMLLIFDKATGKFLGASGYHVGDWNLPSFEIGYWVRSSRAGQGIITESTNALVRFAFDQLKAVRVEIKSEEDNVASRAIAEKLNFTLEAVQKNSKLKTDNKTLCNGVVYARTDAHNLPDIFVSW